MADKLSARRKKRKGAIAGNSHLDLELGGMVRGSKNPIGTRRVDITAILL